VTKPFNPRELIARVKAVLRRSRASETVTPVIGVGDLRIDTARGEVTIGDRQIELRPKEFELLAAFARNPGIVLGRDKLLSLVWGYDYYGDTRTVDVHVTSLRDKLSGSSVHIQTIW